ncbi:MAG: heme o synthase [Armatimonadota bacterium]|nr:heme o synthase [Armatimonadota bacterium]MDR5696907.1 heme o synthase [Armatimonadota bacterium]
MSRFSRYVSLLIVLTFALIVLGGVVRTTGAGDACPDWPLCHGRWIPPPDPLVWVEWSHRLLAAGVGALTIGAVVWTHRLGPAGAALRPVAWTALGLVVFQGMLGGAVVLRSLQAWLVVAHLGAALLFFAALVALHFRTKPTVLEGVAGGRQRAFRSLVLTTLIALYALILLGGYVGASGAGLACPDWPLCRGEVFPPLEPGVPVHYAHRLWAVLLAALLGIVVVRARRDRPDVRSLVHAAAGLYGLQILVGLLNVVTFLHPAVVSAHLGLAALIWGLLIAAYVGAGMPLAVNERISAPEAPKRGVRQTVFDYVSLTKPRIIVLLLVTTAATMFVAAGGRPSAVLVAATIFGGALAAAAANAINCVLDRDIDAVMRRTRRRRPIPAGRVSVRSALLFGVVLAAASFAVLSRAVNPLSAWLALAGIAFYVFVYTMWLKRTTPQNIVIGGAAGAVPPLVAWAAVTGRVEWPAVLLFAIVFFWTPPHFWALALNLRDDYAAAGIPMLPVVSGAAQTHRQMFWYALVTVALTIALVPVARMGVVYAVAAAALGTVFLRRVWGLWRGQPAASAMGVYRYSLLYLALLFGAMVADRVVVL